MEPSGDWLTLGILGVLVVAAGLAWRSRTPARPEEGEGVILEDQGIHFFGPASLLISLALVLALCLGVVAVAFMVTPPEGNPWPIAVMAGAFAVLAGLALVPQIASSPSAPRPGRLRTEAWPLPAGRSTVLEFRRPIPPDGRYESLSAELVLVSRMIVYKFSEEGRSYSGEDHDGRGYRYRDREVVPLPPGDVALVDGVLEARWQVKTPQTPAHPESPGRAVAETLLPLWLVRHPTEFWELRVRPKFRGDEDAAVSRFRLDIRDV